MIMNDEWVKIWEELVFIYSEVLSWRRRTTEIFSQAIRKLAKIHARHLPNICLQCYHQTNLLHLNLQQYINIAANKMDCKYNFHVYVCEWRSYSQIITILLLKNWRSRIENISQVGGYKSALCNFGNQSLGISNTVSFPMSRHTLHSMK